MGSGKWGSGKWGFRKAGRIRKRGDLGRKQAAESSPRVQSPGEQQDLDPWADGEMCHPDPTVREDLSPSCQQLQGLSQLQRAASPKNTLPEMARFMGSQVRVERSCHSDSLWENGDMCTSSKAPLGASQGAGGLVCQSQVPFTGVYPQQANCTQPQTVTL